MSYIQVYAVYFLSDRLHQPMSDIPRLMFINGSIGAAITIAVSPISGWLSDRTGRRKPFVIIAAIIGGVGLVTIGMAQTVLQFLIGSAIAGVGMSVYYAVDLALVAAVLPDPNNSAKDMGIFQIANTLPQSLAPRHSPSLSGDRRDARRQLSRGVHRCLRFCGSRRRSDPADQEKLLNRLRGRRHHLCAPGATDHLGRQNAVSQLLIPPIW